MDGGFSMCECGLSISAELSELGLAAGCSRSDRVRHRVLRTRRCYSCCRHTLTRTGACGGAFWPSGGSSRGSMRSLAHIKLHLPARPCTHTGKHVCPCTQVHTHVVVPCPLFALGETGGHDSGLPLLLEVSRCF